MNFILGLLSGVFGVVSLIAYSAHSEYLHNKKLKCGILVKTPKGIMYLISKNDTHALCYDDQTGNEYKFELTLINNYSPSKNKTKCQTS